MSNSHRSSRTADPPDVRARIRAGLALVPSIVEQMPRLRLADAVKKDELRSYANKGAVAAGRSYDASYGVPFDRWAALKIRGAVLDGLRGESVLPRRMHERLRAVGAAILADKGTARDEGEESPRGSADDADGLIADRLAAMATAYASGILLAREEETLESIEDTRETPEHEVAREELKAAVRAAIAARPEKERILLERYYFDEATLAEASGGRSRAWASRLHARAIGGVAKSLIRSLGRKEAVEAL
jgi:RNA polymerase sigma factor FliA